MIKKVFLLFTLFYAKTLFSQDFELGKVSPEQLMESEYAGDPSISAAILFKDGSTHFEINNQGSWVIVTDVKVKLKIYKKEGYKYADVEIPYYAYGISKEDVNFYDAATYNLVDGQVEKTELTGEGKFVDDVTKRWKVKKITMPNVREGSVLEYRYKIKSPYITSFPDWYFQYDIPVKNARYEVGIPSIFTYNRMLSSYHPVNEKDTIANRRTNTPGATISFDEVVRVYSANDIPALIDENYVDNIDNYRLYVKHELASEKLHDGHKIKYANDWDAVVKSIYKDDDFGSQLKQQNYFKKDLDLLLAGKENNEEIIETVFNYVKNRMAWDEMHGYTCSRGVKKAYDEKVGNVAEINLMLVAMLRYAGLKANPVLLSTRNNGHATFVNRNSFNYVIAAIEGTGDMIFLDATSKNSSVGILPLRALNITGRLMRKDLTSADVNLLPKNISKENTSVVVQIDKDGNAAGKVKKQYSDYNAFIIREKFAGTGMASNVERHQKATNASVQEYQLLNKDDFSAPLTEEFSYSSSALCDVVGDKIYLSPLLFYTTSENPFKQEKRAYPIDFIYPNQEKFIITINIPEEYEIESMPESYSIIIEGGVGKFKFNIGALDTNVIQIVVVNDMSYARLEPNYYQSVRDFYAAVIAKQAQKIVLSKKV